MPPGFQLLLPAILLVFAGLVTWFAGAAGVRVGRVAAAAGAWLALAALLALWVPARAPVEFRGMALGRGVQLGQRLDALDFAVALALLVPACLLLTFQRRGWQSAGAGALAVALALTAVLSDSVTVTAFAGGSAATVLMLPIRSDSEAGTTGFWPSQFAGWLATLAAAAALGATSGTSVYSAVPVASVRTALLGLMVVGALACSGALPWRPWAAELWDRPRLVTGSLAAAVLVPAAFLVLLRTYELGGGRWPAPALSVAVALAGAAVVLGAAARGQAATTRRGAAAEMLPGLAGYTLVALAFGTPLGLTAAVTGVLALGLTAALLHLLPEDRSGTSLAGAALAAGIPPGIGFGVRLLTIEAGVEAGSGSGLLAALLGLAWLLELAAAARASRLPAALPGAVLGGSVPGTLAGLVLILAGGAGLGLLSAGLTVPAAREVVPFAVNSITGTPYAVLSASGGWAAAALGVPVAALALLLLPALRADVVPARRRVPDPFFSTPAASAPRRAYEWLAALRAPEQYRSLFNPRAVEAAMARGQPVLWVVLLLVLAVVVNR